MTLSPTKMVIITSYFDGESYGLLGPQMAATIINRFSDFQCIVAGITRSDDQALLKKVLVDHFNDQRPVVGFSTLSGRDDLFRLADEFKSEGALTILAGPQAGIDFLGETGWETNEKRFEGYHACFDFGLQGPAEQILPLTNDMGQTTNAEEIPGLLYRSEGRFYRNPSIRWRSSRLNRVDWTSFYRLNASGFISHPITSAQVLQQIGCPYAAKSVSIGIDAPAFMPDAPKITLSMNGCSFCDVAVDKGYCGTVDEDDVLMQIANLPTDANGRKIPFELINENPFHGLPELLTRFKEEKISISQINLTTRADYLLRGEKYLRTALKMARHMHIRIICTSVGFESFSDLILHNLNKGISLSDNLKAVTLMRRLKRLFPFQWGYSRQEGGNHGMIHPTPWDTPQVMAEMETVVKTYDLAVDILPPHSTPLIIHHGSGLGAWIRQLEAETETIFNRKGSIVEWWEKDERFTDGN